MTPSDLLYLPLPFVGREPELHQIGNLLADPACRLLTLIGPGGIGKTRLAIEAARQSTFPNGVYIVPLQSLTHSHHLVTAIAESLRISFYGEQEPRAQLLDYLREKHLLLLLDNFEHLLDGIPLLSEILQTALGAKLLVTSRERLNLLEEWVLDVGGLNYPSAESNGSIEAFSAVQLFTQRARQVQANFALDENAEAVKIICQQVEGMPLGIELAAGWVRALSCQQIADEIDRGLDILATTARNVPEAHRSIRIVFEHSWKLLSDDEQAVFRKLSVFRGGFTRQAAEEVAGASLPILSALIDKSLLRADANGRYDAHELLRQFGEEQLNAAQEVEPIQAAKCACFSAFMRRQEKYLSSRKHKAGLAAIRGEVDNLRSACEWAIASGNIEEIEQAIQILYTYAELDNFTPGEAIKGLAAAVEKLRPLAANPAAEAGMAKAMLRQAHLCFVLGLEPQQSIQRCRTSLAIFQRLGLPEEQALTCRVLGLLLGWQGDSEEAASVLQQGLALYQQHERPDGVGYVLQALGSAAYSASDFDQASKFLREALEIFQELDRPLEIAWCESWLSGAAFQQRRYAEAYQLTQRSLASLLEQGEGEGRLANLYNQLGRIASALDRPEEALQHYSESLKIARETGDVAIGIDFLNIITYFLMDAGYREFAVESFTFLLRQPQLSALAKDKAAHLIETELKPHLTTETFATAEENGQTHSLEDLLDRVAVSLHRVQQPSPLLTARETEILCLIADGLSNRDIAERLFLTPGTVKWYLGEIYSKLNVNSRTQAVARARELKLLA